jgi:dihydropteroate synthase
MREIHSRQSAGFALGRSAVAVLCSTRPVVCGIFDVAPDSFSDGVFLDPGRALAHGVELARQGAGESTRPGASRRPLMRS